MPMLMTARGFDVSYSRGICFTFSLLALLFAALMFLAGLNSLFPVLQGTRLAWLEIGKQPVYPYAIVTIAGALVLLYVALWFARTAAGHLLAIRATADRIESRSIIGRRRIAWADVSGALLHKGTIMLQPRDPRARAVPLPTFLTAVSVDNLHAALLRYRPDVFNELTD